MKTNCIIKFLSSFILAVFLITAIACSQQHINQTESTATVFDSTSTDAGENNSVPVGFVAEEVEDPIDRSQQAMRIGAYLWNGFISIAGMTNRHMEEFLEYREPLWGYGNPDIEEMEFQIQMAYDFGLDFFAVDYYSSVNDAYDSTTLKNFVNAKNSNLLDFCLLVVNADFATSPSPDNWDKAQANYVFYMTRENALKVDGKPVIMFISPDNLISTMGSRDAVKIAFEKLEAEMISLGYPGIVIVGCTSAYEGLLGDIEYNESRFNPKLFQNKLEGYLNIGFDAFSGYNYIQSLKHTDENGNQTYDCPYSYMTKSHENCWNVFSQNSDVSYMPVLLGGWDDRPRETEIAGYSCYADDRTGEAFTEHILQAYRWIQDNPNQALGNLAVIYAWDEIDEGGFIIPTYGEGYNMLNGLWNAVVKIRDISQHS